MPIKTIEGPSFYAKDILGTGEIDAEHSEIIVEGWSPGGVALMNRRYTVAMPHDALLEILRDAAVLRQLDEDDAYDYT